MKGKDIFIIVHFIDGKEKEILWDARIFVDARLSDVPKPQGNYIEIPTEDENLLINWSEIRYIESFEVEEVDEDQKD